MVEFFEHLIVLGRPAGGKSEFIDYMTHTPDDVRINKYHIGHFKVLDDFVWLWEKFEDDDIWEKLGHKRLYSKKSEHAYVIEEDSLFDFMIQKINKEIKKYLSDKEFYKNNTLLIEFSRGAQKAYDNAFNLLSKELLEKSCIIYISVSFEESWRRNVTRYQEKQKHSILAHMVPREDMDKYYSTDDWPDITNNKPDGYLEYHNLKIPFVTMNNEPESTDPVVLDERYGNALRRLMELTVSLRK